MVTVFMQKKGRLNRVCQITEKEIIDYSEKHPEYIYVRYDGKVWYEGIWTDKSVYDLLNK